MPDNNNSQKITIITPFIDGEPDFEGDQSSGQRVYLGHLTIEQIIEKTREPAYPEQACLIEYYAKVKPPEIEKVTITFHREAGTQPVRPPSSASDLNGTYFEYDDRADLHYEARYSTIDG